MGFDCTLSGDVGGEVWAVNRSAVWGGGFVGSKRGEGGAVWAVNGGGGGVVGSVGSKGLKGGMGGGGAGGQ